MEKRTCKLCFRSFANGRALGGHMRSHLAPPSKRAPRPPPPPPLSASSTSSHEAAEGYELRENPRRSFRLVDPEFAVALDAGSSSAAQDRASDTESPRAPPEAEPASSVSDATPEEDVALSLMILSRDAWTREEGGGGEQEPPRPPAAAKRRSRHQCGTCRKVFRSYQALGGHRASHKRSNSCSPATSTNPDANRSHECPVCFRVFASGQALGGHKRSHLIAFTSASTPTTDTSSSPAAPKFGDSPIDLNLPAPMDDDDDDDDVELSAVSDAGFAAFRLPY